MRSIRICLVAMVVVGAMGLMGSAFAQGSAEQPGDQVQPRIFQQGQPGEDDDVLGVVFPSQDRAPSPAPSALPFTGADLALYVAAGGLAIAIGSSLIARTRHSRGER